MKKIFLPTIFLIVITCRIVNAAETTGAPCKSFTIGSRTFYVESPAQACGKAGGTIDRSGSGEKTANSALKCKVNGKLIDIRTSVLK